MTFKIPNTLNPNDPITVLQLEKILNDRDIKEDKKDRRGIKQETIAILTGIVIVIMVFSLLYGNITSLDNRIGALDNRITSLDEKIDTKIAALDNRIGALDNRITSLDEKIDTKIAALDEKIDTNHRQIITILLEMQKNKD